MKKSKMKIIISIIIFLSIIFLFHQVNANTINANDWKPKSTTVVKNAGSFFEIANKIIGLIQIIGSIAAVVSLIIIGIKYILGSVEEKAEYKKTLQPYVIGAIMLFGITNILGIVVDLVGNFD